MRRRRERLSTSIVRRPDHRGTASYMTQLRSQIVSMIHASFHTGDQACHVQLQIVVPSPLAAAL